MSTVGKVDDNVALVLPSETHWIKRDRLQRPNKYIGHGVLGNYASSI